MAATATKDSLQGLHRFHTKYDVHWMLTGLVAALLLIGLGIFIGLSWR